MINSHRRAELYSALIEIVPALVATAPMGLLFGTLAVTKGMAPFEVALMSALIFAGGSQFAALELWQPPLPLVALLLSTALINSRHIPMGLSLAPKLAALRPLQRFLGCAVMSDANWAMAEQRASQQPLTPWYFLGMGAAYWANWVLWSTAGALIGPLLGDPKRFGADFAFVAIFIGLLVSVSKGPRAAWVVAASAAAATLVHVFAGSPWHIFSGAVAGVTAAMLCRNGEAT